MSYLAVDQLTNDVTFAGRSRAAVVEQAETFKDDQRPDFVALSNDVLRGDGEIYNTFTRMAAAGPGIAAKADTGNDTIDQALVTDEDLLSLTQGNYPTVAALYYDEQGEPLR